MLTEEQFYEESLNANLYYLRILRDFCINIQLSFYNNNEYKEKIESLAKKSQDLGRKIITYTEGVVPLKGYNYEIYYTKYTLPTEKLTEKLFSLDLATDITENQLQLLPKEDLEVDEEKITAMEIINQEALEISKEFIKVIGEILKELVSNNLFSYSYPALCKFMIETITLYIKELNRLQEKIKQDPIIALDTEYEYNITSYEIVSFLRGLINPSATKYIERLNTILNDEYPKLLKDYNNLPLSPENQKLLIERSVEIIRDIRLLISNMLEDLLNSKLYFIIEALAIDTFYRNINYFLYILNIDIEEL